MMMHRITCLGLLPRRISTTTVSAFASSNSDGVFKFQIERDYDNRFYKKQLTKKDFRLETEKLSQMFNEHPALFKLTPKRDKIRRAPQFPEPAPDRSGI
ncbi:unnamed protein product [Rotaria magnacalcarata]